jgi:hypothetical protein
MKMNTQLTKNLSDTGKVVLRGKFIAMSYYIKKSDGLHTHTNQRAQGLAE